MTEHTTPETELPQGQKPEEEKPDPPVQPQRKKQSVAIYLIILFAAAFLLLLMAYFMQQRNSNAIIGNLQDSLTSFQTVEELREENGKLQQQIQDLEEKAEALQEENETLSQQYMDASTREAQAQALADLRNSLYVAEQLYEQENYQGAAEQLVDIPADDLALLSGESTLGAPSEQERYDTLKTHLMELGFVQEGPDSQLQLTEPAE